jgi:hypothetical protein
VEEEVVVVEGVVEVEVVCSTQRAEKPEDESSERRESQRRESQKKKTRHHSLFSRDM